MLHCLIAVFALTKLVDPFTGTSGTGHTHPCAARPFGMIQAGPDTGSGTWAYCSGYQYEDKKILGYSQNHLSGTGCPDYGDVQVLPFSGPLRELPMSSGIDKRTEKAEPGYYGVRQYEDDVAVEIAAAKRAAIYRLTWGVGREAKILVNLPFGHNCASERPGWAICRTSSPNVKVVGRQGILGEYFREGWIERRRVCFVIEFDRPWKQVDRLPDKIQGEAPRYVISFGDMGAESLRMKVALSMNSSESAKLNLAAEIPQWDFESIREEARLDWERMLYRAQVEGSIEQKKNWYSALYHLFLQPNDWSDVGEKPYYTTLSFWDTFRAAHPLYTILAPEIVIPVIDSVLRLWKEKGRLPVMSYGGHNMDCMIGNHSIPVIADAYLKGFRGFNVDETLSAMTNTLSMAHPGKPKEDWDQYARYGYFPFDLNTGEGVSRTLECAYDDACVARFATAVGHPEVAREYARRSKNWLNVFDRESGFMRGKDSKGNWRKPFDPLAYGHEDSWAGDFTEANSWQYTWHVMQDPVELIDVMGGREKFARKLQMLFNERTNISTLRKSSDISGMIGQYAHGNEPSHHIAYLFQYAGRPDLTAKFVRTIFDTQYHSGPAGLCGNDDCGQMSAWYIFSAMGFYPLDPCGGDYVLGAPQMPRMTLSLVNGKTFVVEADNLSRANAIVESVQLNGKTLGGTSVRHADIVRGGIIRFQMKR